MRKTGNRNEYFGKVDVATIEGMMRNNGLGVGNGD